jgi:ketosteroid isomerase-like protein
VAVETGDETRAVIDAFDAAFGSGDIDRTMALMTEDCVFESTNPGPDGVRYTGQTAVREYFQDLFRNTAEARFRREEVFACGDRAVLRWVYSWGSGSQAGHVRGVDILRVRDGKVAEKLSYVKG